MLVSSLKFISGKREKDLNKLNIYTLDDLCRHFPRDYLDLTSISTLKYAYNNEFILTKAEVLKVESNPYGKPSSVKALCQQHDKFGDYLFSAIWFNQPYVANKLTRGEYFFYGRVQNKMGFANSLVQPSFEPASKSSCIMGIIPVYSLSGALTQKVMRMAIKQALEKLSLTSVIPIQLCKKYQLLSLKDAYKKVHFPQSQDDIKDGSNRIALEEYFLLISAFNVIKGGRDEARLNHYTATSSELNSFIASFPFKFTNGQNTAVKEIYANLKSPRKMNRLLQGDVGSGKTAVALCGIFMAVASGYQAAMIAPTEVLARQNAKLIERYFPNYNVATLTGSTTAAQKREIKKKIASGEINIVCGTHAVIQPDVIFKNLCFVVCDEQHRFGVAQRAALTDKGEGADVLIMSATPIPRTLSLIFYGDLDITTIKDKPANRIEISTSIIPERKYADMYRYVEKQAKEGNRVYFVCPKIEGDEEGTTMSVTKLYQELKIKLPTLKIALMHGKLKEKEKNEIMEDFKEGVYDCLVSTTVIEVGVDVPEATIIIIYNAERFGLSQLHQLRGRVGRGDKKSYCFLLFGTENEDSLERLSVIKNSTDGFVIAEEDLKIRGGGDFMGTKQSGRILSEIKNLKFPVEVIFTAKALSDEAFSGLYDTTLLTRLAAAKYESLKDITLN